MSHTYVTYFDINYAVKGLAMLDSLRRHEPGCTVTVVCLDDDTFRLLAELGMEGVRPVPLKLIEKGDEKLVAARTNRSLVEYYWTLTPTILLRFLEDMEPDAVLTYVDADLWFFSSPAPVFEELGTNSVLIHKHNFSHRYAPAAIYGVYNVGLLVFRKDADGIAVLHWWRDRCLEWCYDRCEDGKMGDQKYLESFTSLTKKLTVSANPGVGVAPWNFTGYRVDERKGIPCVDGTPSVFFHYHSAAYLAPGCLVPCSDLTYRWTQDLLRLYAVPYLDALDEMLERVRCVRPTFTHGFKTTGLDSAMCAVVRREQIDAFRATYPCILSLDENHRLCASPQLVGYAKLSGSDSRGANGTPATKKRSLEQAVSEFRRFPAKPRLLNLGCGHHLHPNWLNVDISPSLPTVYDVDLRKPWPLPSDFFDVVYHSHVLEHMSKNEGLAFLRKCYDVLKPGGILRVAIPDLEGIARNYLMALEEAELAEEGAADRHDWMVLELVDQAARHHSGGEMAEYFKQDPLPQKEFVLSRIGWEGEQLARALQGTPCRTVEEGNPVAVGAFRLGGEVHRWMYDVFSLRQALKSAGFVQAHRLNATESAYPDFFAFHLDADENGKTRKPDSLFMEARKPHTVTAAEHEKLCDGTIRLGGQTWSGDYPDWKSAQDVAGGYDEESIFCAVREACRAVRDGKALWERDSVLFHEPEINRPLLACLMSVAAQNDGRLHVLDFGGSLGSTYVQHRAVFSSLAECTWHVVEQEHFVRCGREEFTTPNLRFHDSLEEALAAAPINVILLSSVLQYIEKPYVLLKQMAATRLSIIIDRTPLLENRDRITVQTVPAEIYEASYACHWLDKRRIEWLLQAAGCSLSPWFPSAVDPKGFYGVLALPTSRNETR